MFLTLKKIKNWVFYFSIKYNMFFLLKKKKKEKKVQHVFILFMEVLKKPEILKTNAMSFFQQLAALFTLIFIILINLAVGILPHVDNFAHIGGFLTGFLLGFVLLVRPQFGWSEGRSRPADTRLKSKYKIYQYAFWIAATILLIVG